MALLAVLGLGAWALNSAISDVGLQTIVDELAAAQDQWPWAALLLSPPSRSRRPRPAADPRRHRRDGGRDHAGLAASGVPEAAAVSTALIFRVVTLYLPPVWGSFAMRALRAREYI